MGRKPGGTGPRAILLAIREPLLLIVLIEAFLLHFLFGMHYALAPLYLLAIGATLAELGVIRALFSGTQVAARLGAGWLTVRFGHRKVAGGALVGQVVALVLVAATTDLLVLTALSMAFGLGRGLMLVANTLGLAEASDRAAISRGSSSGVFNAANDLGVLIGPVGAGFAALAVGIGPSFVVLPLGVLAVYAAALALMRTPSSATRAQ